jgi:arginyl-tRNA synthetase
MAKEDPALDDEARAWSLRLEQGDPTARELWQWMVNLTISANQRNYDRLGVHFDHIYGESFYESMLPDVIQEALDKRAGGGGSGQPRAFRRRERPGGRDRGCGCGDV